MLRNQLGWGDAALLQLCAVPLIAIIGMMFLDTGAIRRPLPVA